MLALLHVKEYWLLSLRSHNLGFVVFRSDQALYFVKICDLLEAASSHLEVYRPIFPTDLHPTGVYEGTIKKSKGRRVDRRA